jgi:hypothetical protein
MYHPHVDFLLGGPLFLFALVIANAGWNATPRMMRAPPPDIQGVVAYIINSPFVKERETRRGYARLACKLAARLFVMGEMCAPAGVYPDIRMPPRSDKWPSWLRWLMSLDPVEAMGLLVANSNSVPDIVYNTVERHYNQGLEAAAKILPFMATLKLEPGELTRRINVLKDNLDIGAVSPMPRSPESRGYFFQVSTGDRAGPEGGHKVCCVNVQQCCTQWLVLLCTS